MSVVTSGSPSSWAPVKNAGVRELRVYRSGYVMERSRSPSDGVAGWSRCCFSGLVIDRSRVDRFSRSLPVVRWPGGLVGEAAQRVGDDLMAVHLGTAGHPLLALCHVGDGGEGSFAHFRLGAEGRWCVWRDVAEDCGCTFGVGVEQVESARPECEDDTQP